MNLRSMLTVSFEGWKTAASLVIVIFTLCMTPPVSCQETTVAHEDDEVALCSVNAQYCDPRATCKVTGEIWACECTEGLKGDGLKGDNHTGCGHFCTSQNDCLDIARCNVFSKCECISGYVGNGYDTCTDVDDCLQNVCSAHARCENEPGSYKCACREVDNYYGNGTHCRFRCSTSLDCNVTTEMCRGSECVCKDGYQLQDEVCTDTDECAKNTHDCDENAFCTNTDGSFSCTCNPGYEDLDEGRSCRRYPINCADIRQKNSKAKSTHYKIDPDGEGDMPPIEVNCQMRSDVSVTVMKIVASSQKTFNKTTTQSVQYEHKTAEIIAVIGTSGFCYQEMTYTCTNGADLRQDYFEWTAGTGVSQNYTCPCGQFGGCRNATSKCNCDGDMETGSDGGKIIDKELLPIVNVTITTGQGTGRTSVSHVYCAEKPFDIPRDCHDAKFNYNEKVNGPLLIDVDGPDGAMVPFSAFCLMTFEPHVGITEILPKVSKVNSSYYDVNYQISREAIEQLIEISEFCQQEISYKSTNSRLMANGQMRGFYSDFDGNPMIYWADGNGHAYMCGCGLTGTCDKEGYWCNCDIVDNTTHTDSGKLVDKKHLPVASATFLDNGPQEEFDLGPLRCSQRQFDIPYTCQEIIDEGQTESDTYLIDPDGPEGLNSGSSEDNTPPFAVFCEMKPEISQGTTVIHHTESHTMIAGSRWWQFDYSKITQKQLSSLRDRSTYCTQSVDIFCEETPISGLEQHSWGSFDGVNHHYYNGDGLADGCRCAVKKACAEPLKRCNCDSADNVSRSDSGVLVNKKDLPVTMTSLSNVTVGPLRCFETFPSCAELMGRQRLDSENAMESGLKFVDPDGAGGVDAFEVTCEEEVTIITPGPVSPGNTTVDTPGTQKCFDITYTDSRGRPLTSQQVQALVDASDHCEQKLSVTCVNAPLTNNHHFVSCANKTQSGWAGSGGDDKCACGVTGTCDGDDGTLCNCNVEDNSTKVDGGSIVKKDRLPVCAICLTLPSISSEQAQSIPIRSAEYLLGKLKCGRKPIGVGKSCQARRNQKESQSGTVMLNPDPDNGGEPVPVLCVAIPDPPVGKVVIKPTTANITVPEEGIEQIINYYVFNFDAILKIINSSIYCTQALYLHCDGAVLNMTSNVTGFYSVNNVRQKYWPGCAGGACNCQLGANGQTDGGLIIDPKVLPVLKVILGPSPGNRSLEIGNLECFDIPRDCDEILKMGLNANPNEDDIYAIDPDGAGGVEYFSVGCDFNTNSNIGITVVKVVEGNDSVKINGTEEVTWNVTYVDATSEQIHTLANISGYCYQGITYQCNSSPISNTSYWLDFDGGKWESLGTGFGSNVKGCACAVSKSCPSGEACRCDATGYKGWENGYFMDRDTMPATNFHFKGHSSHSKTEATITELSCGPIPFKLPKDCHEVFNKLSKLSGEYVIWPKTYVDPFIVYCDMDIIRNGGITVVSNTWEELYNVTYDEVMEIIYFGATFEQLIALNRVSRYCQQPIKYLCRNTKFMETSYQQFGGFSNTPQNIFGGCNCGIDWTCGGSEEWDILEKLNRTCNCDAADNESRADAGVLQIKRNLPVASASFQDTGRPLAEGWFKLGKLYCADKPFDLDECKLGFNDCHKDARCINTFGAYRCQCRTGFKGKGHGGKLLANGRNCYDDNECNLYLCPYSSDCLNTPGSFTCTCKAGYTQTGPRTCEDIDECVTNENDCDVNAKCFNMPGSYMCRCKPGYRGNGTHCEPLGRCVCFGDPHCQSFDGRGLHFQGACSYVLSRDNCNGNATYQVIGEFWQRPDVTSSGVTWVKEVTIFAYGFRIRLMQGGEVRVNGVKMTDPARLSAYVYVLKRLGGLIQVYLGNGVEIKWNGRSTVEVSVPGALRNGVCGFCGNYNNDTEDDWTVGPACPEEAGSITDFSTLFGTSWMSTESSEPTCPVTCEETEEPDPCDDPIERAKATDLCDRLFKKDDAFKMCFQEMDDASFDFYYESCIYDLCENDGDASITMCDVADNTADTCETVYKISITKYQPSKYCEETGCDVNMIKTDCMPSSWPTCFDLVSEQSEPLPTEDNTGEQCSPGCMCKEGYYMEEGGCVPPEECGCTYNTNYYTDGETLTLGDCDQIGVCTSGQGFNFTEIENCNENATCELKNGRFGCHCIPGYYGDGIKKCKEDPCLENPCMKHAACLHAEDTQEGYVCECEMGYAGDCGNCTDIDECATETAKCKDRSKCNNTEGSYQCVCLDGYVLNKGQCQDINECNLAKISNTNVCRNNSRCINRIGSYECPCCDGHVLNEVTSECEASDTKEAFNGTQCCTCSIAICEQKGKVCGEDGKKYDDIRDMVLSRCEEGFTAGKQVQVDYFKTCQASCSNVKCPKFQECSIDPKTKAPRCDCEKCTDEEIISGEVCSKHLVIYKNKCVFKKMMCRHDIEVVLLPTMDKCNGKGHGSRPVTPWSEWGTCSETCGKGNKTKTREAHRNMTDEEQKRYPLTTETDCYSPPCPDSICVVFTCEKAAAECVPQGEDEDPKCECPTCRNEGSDPVCGQLGSTDEHPITWHTACHLQKDACRFDKDFNILHPGPCGVTPVDCSRLPKRGYIFSDDEACSSDKEIDQFDCSGGCGIDPENCCLPSGTDEVDVSLTCTNGTVIQTTVGKISGCKCQERVGGTMP